jgi:hypothetical protein
MNNKLTKLNETDTWNEGIQKRRRLSKGNVENDRSERRVMKVE